jgi:hypothetical protein
VTPLAAYALAAELSFYVHPERVRGARLAELTTLAQADADAAEATPLPDRGVVGTVAWLVGVSHLESGFRIVAHGRQGEEGAFQLMHHWRGDCRGAGEGTVEQQAREAIRRWRLQGATGYTGETPDWTGTAPLAVNRSLWGAIYEASHPYEPVTDLVIAREP